MEHFELPHVEGLVWPEPFYPHRPQGVEGNWGAEQEARAAYALTPPRKVYARVAAWREEQERASAE